MHSSRKWPGWAVKTPFLLALPSICLAGCISFKIDLSGPVPSRPLPLGGGDGREPWGALACDQLGNLQLNGQPLQLPAARENQRLGIQLVDSSLLPEAWRPQHAKKGGLMVTALERASPLAIEGLRPFDVLKILNGVPIADLDQFMAAVQKIKAGEELSLEAATPRGAKFIRASMRSALADETEVSIPLLAQYHRSQTSFGLGFGPGLITFAEWYQDSKGESGDGKTLFPVYLESREWSFLYDLIETKRSKNLETGQVKGSWRLFWLFKLGEQPEGSQSKGGKT